MKKWKLGGALRITLLYFLFGCLWIFLSDAILARMVQDPATMTTIQNYKGWFFVALSAALIYYLVRQYLLTKQRAELKLWEQEEQYRLLFETNLDAILMIDPVGRVRDANPAACTIFGFPRKGFRSQKLGDIVDVTDLRYGQNLEARLRQGLYIGELNLIKKDGTHFPGEVSTALFKDSNGTYHTSLVIRDITEQKMSEERARISLERLKTLHDIDLAIIASEDLGVVLNLLLDMLVASLDVDAADILLLDAATNRLMHVEEKGFNSRTGVTKNIQLGLGLPGRAVLERKLLSIPDLQDVSQELVRTWWLPDEKFVSYFGVPLYVKGNLKGVLEVFKRTRFEPDEEWLDFLDSLAGQAAIAIDNAQVSEGLYSANFELTLAYDATLEGWSRALDLRDKETEGHTQRVTEFTLQFAQQLHIDNDDLIHVRRGALLHDIGKLGIPDEILLKPAVLTEEEWAIMRKHPVYAFNLLSPIPYLRPALDIPFAHHEKWDGSGYPRGLEGEQIPMAARLFAVVDVWDALRSERPYRAAWPEEKALDYIHEGSGTHFDPQVVDVFFQMMQQGSLVI